MPDVHSPGLLRLVWTTGLWRILLTLFLWSFGYTTLLPQVPTLQTDFFARKYAGYDIHCQEYPPDVAPPACQNAHSDVVVWTSWTALVTNSFLAFVCSPLVGDLSDQYGRKPFIVLGLGLTLLPVGVVLLYLQGLLSLAWYFPMTAVSGTVSILAIFLAYVADLLQPKHRTAGFGLVVAAVSLGFLFGPYLGSRLDAIMSVWVCAGAVCAAVINVVLFIPEPVRDRQPGVKGPPPRRALLHSAAWLGLIKCWRIVTRDSLFTRLALCMAIVGLVSEGMQDLLMQYLQLAVGFTTADQGLLFMVLGGCNLLVQGVLLSWLVPLMGEQKLLLVGLLLFCGEQLLLAYVRVKWFAFLAVGIGSMANVAWPAISAIKANNTCPEQQGVVQGALAGVRALATGLGPVLFAQIFKASTRTDSPWGYAPGLVFLVAAALTAVAAIIAATVPHDAGRSKPVRVGGAAAAAAGVAGAAVNKHCEHDGMEASGSGSCDDVENSLDLAPSEEATPAYALLVPIHDTPDAPLLQPLLVVQCPVEPADSV